MAAAIPLLIAAIGGGATIYSSVQQKKTAKKARQQADGIRQKEEDKITAFRDRLSSGGRGLLGSTGDDDLGNTLGS